MKVNLEHYCKFILEYVDRYQKEQWTDKYRELRKDLDILISVLLRLHKECEPD